MKKNYLKPAHFTGVHSGDVVVVARNSVQGIISVEKSRVSVTSVISVVVEVEELLSDSDPKCKPIDTFF